MLVTISPPARIGGTVSAPPSKSMAHRAVLCSALAKGTSHIENLEFSKDISASDFGALCRANPAPMGGIYRQKNIFLT